MLLILAIAGLVLVLAVRLIIVVVAILTLLGVLARGLSLAVAIVEVTSLRMSGHLGE
jgi:hypothetical protein